MRKMNFSPLNGAVVVLVHGYPGAGKGTQCALLQERFGFTHISVGDLLRKEIKTNSKIAKMIRTYVMEGKIVPVKCTFEILEKAMKRSKIKKFLLDGFPRDEANLNGWIEFVSKLNITVKFVLHLICDKETCEERILGNERDNNRMDDNAETLQKRFKAYEELMGPIHNYYKSKRKEVDGQGEKRNDTPEQVFERVKQVFEEACFTEESVLGPDGSLFERRKVFEEDRLKKQPFRRQNGFEHDPGTLKSPKARSSKQCPSSLKGCTVVLVHGYPGAGKGTQSWLLKKHFGFMHISVGDLMRKEMKKKDSNTSAMIASYVMEGKIVPAALTCKVLKKAMENSNAKEFLIDGYPKDERNLTTWIEFVRENEINVKFVLILNCVKETCRTRILGNARGSGRKDDNPVTVEKRFKAYESLMDPIHEYYKAKRREVDGEGTSTFDTREEVFERVQKVFEEEGFSLLENSLSVNELTRNSYATGGQLKPLLKVV